MATFTRWRHTMAFSRSAGADQRVRLWRATNLTAEGALPPRKHTASVFALAVLPPAKGRSVALLASADARGEVVLWDLSERVAVRTLSGGGGSICALLASADGATLHAAGGRGELYLWHGLDQDDEEKDDANSPPPPRGAPQTSTVPPPQAHLQRVLGNCETGVLCLTMGSGTRSSRFAGSMDGRHAGGTRQALLQRLHPMRTIRRRAAARHRQQRHWLPCLAMQAV